MKFKSKKQTSPKRIKKATAIKAKREDGGFFKKFLAKLKK